MKKSANSLLVSVIIPAYNAEKYLRESVDSILNQTYKNLEVIIINDCSTDGTLKIALDYEKSDKRVRVINNPKNLGIGENRSLGIKSAKGEFICWQDADDISLPDRIESQVKYLQSHPQVGIVGGFMLFFDETGDLSTRKYAESDSELRKTIFLYNSVAQPASMARSVVYKKVGLYNPEYRVDEDLEMLFRIGREFKFANIQQLVLRYRQSGNSLTRKNLRKMEITTIKLRFRFAKYPEYHFGPLDLVYNMAQFCTMILPVKFRMKLFKIIRGDK